ncbi:MAG: hypothetical protein LBC68_09605 [Prevotellaceae bacterium]|jgi:hypothetical protein|nr:hypothetical protein [Prevotellaceae bacterium]
MKKYFSYSVFAVLISALCLSFSSCSKDDEPEDLWEYMENYKSTLTVNGLATTNCTIETENQLNGGFEFWVVTEKGVLKIYRKALSMDDMENSSIGENILTHLVYDDRATIIEYIDEENDYKTYDWGENSVSTNYYPGQMNVIFNKEVSISTRFMVFDIKDLVLHYGGYENGETITINGKIGVRIDKM